MGDREVSNPATDAAVVEVSVSGDEELRGAEHATHDVLGVECPRRSNREGTLTARGREYWMEQAKANCSRLRNQLTRQETLIRQLLWSSSAADRINYETQI